MMEKFPNLVKDRTLHMQEGKQTPRLVESKEIYVKTII